MKKQILFLAMFTMALIFAGTGKVFGQLGASTNPITPLSCVSTGDPQPLHPFAGVPYIYSLDGTTGTEKAEIYTWWATKNPAFIPSEGANNIANMLLSPTTTTVGTALSATSATYGVATNIGTEPTANQVTITWSADILAATEYQGDAAAAGTIADPSPTFVVGYATGELCADNIQVFEINPLPNFTVDIAPINPADDLTLAWGNLVDAEDCVDQIQSATYNSTSKEIDMIYGTNIIYFEVAAANFVKDWTPTFTLIQSAGFEGLRTTQTAVLEMYETLAEAVAGTGSLGDNSATPWTATGGTWATGVNLTATSPADIATGVSVFVKVIITNDTEESLTENPFILAVDAQDNTATGIWDMEDDDCTVLDNVADQVDQAAVTITPRPTLNDTTDDTLADPDTYIEKTNP